VSRKGPFLTQLRRVIKLLLLPRNVSQKSSRIQCPTNGDALLPDIEAALERLDDNATLQIADGSTMVAESRLIELRLLPPGDFDLGVNPTLTLVANSGGRSELKSCEVRTSCLRGRRSICPGCDSQQIDGGRGDDVLKHNVYLLSGRSALSNIPYVSKVS